MIFDSHPRAKHPDGAAFIFNTSLDATAFYLSELLKYDPGLLADHNMQWQAQLLANYSGHTFICKQTLVDSSELMEAVIDTSLEVLVLKAEVTELKRQNRFLQDDKERLRQETERLEGEVDDLEIAIRQERQIARAASFVPKSIPGAWNTNWDSSEAGPSTLNRGGTMVHNAHPLVSTSKSTPKPSSQEPNSGANTTSTPSSPPKLSPTISKGKPTFRISDEVDDDDFVFATRIQWEWLEENEASVKESSKLAIETQGKYHNEDAQFDESIQLAIETQRQFEQEDARLRSQFVALQAEATSTFHCGICLEDQSEFMVSRIEPCGHEFCRDCIRDYIRSRLGEHRFPILCPVRSAERDTVDPGSEWTYGETFRLILTCQI